MDFQKIEIAYEVEKLEALFYTEDIMQVIVAVGDAVKHRNKVISYHDYKIAFINKEKFFEYICKKYSADILFQFIQIFKNLKISILHSTPRLCQLLRQNKEINDLIILNMFQMRVGFFAGSLSPEQQLNAYYNMLCDGNYYSTEYYAHDIQAINGNLTCFKHFINFSELCNPNFSHAKVFWKYIQVLMSQSYKTLKFDSIYPGNSFFHYFNEHAQEIDWNSFSLLWDKSWRRLFLEKRKGSLPAEFTLETEFNKFIVNWRKFNNLLFDNPRYINNGE